MTQRIRTQIVRVILGAGMVLAVCFGVLLHSAFPDTLGPIASLTVPLVFVIILVLAIGNLVLVVNRQRHESHELQEEVRSAVAREHAIEEDVKVRDARLRLLESAVVHTHDGVVVIEAEPGPGPGRSVVFANDAFLEMTGYRRNEVIGRSLYQLRGPETDPDTLAQLRFALDAGQPLRAELMNHRKDGTPFWVDLSLVPIPEPDGSISYWVMVQRDVTDRKNAEESVRRSEGLFRGIFEGTSAGVSLTDPLGRFVACNPSFAALVGRRVEEVLTLTAADVSHPDDYTGQLPLVEQVSTGTRDRYSYTKRYVHPDGEEVWAELTFAAIRGVAGKLEYGLGVSINVTEKRRLEEQLRQSHKLEAIGQMAGGIAHDFNNLLTAVLGNLALVKLPERDANRPLLATVEQAARRAAELTRMLVGYARRNQLQAGPLKPEKAFEEVFALLRRTFDPRIHLVSCVEPECNPLLADSGLLSQALVNLCLNARDAMPDGGTLTLSAESVFIPADHSSRPADIPPGPFVRVSVSDTGCGMPDSVKARVFEPFFTTKGPGKGTGLGLPMVMGIVKQHHGWVDFATVPGAGSRIDLYMPAALAPETPTSIATPPPRLFGERPMGEGRTILLVDDEPMIRHLGRTVLERAGYDVLTAEDGSDAVEVFSQERGRISLVILDAVMPRMSGPDAFRHMTALDPAARVLFSTGYSPEDLSGVEGSVGLLAKPYRPEGLLAAVRDALNAPTTAG